MVWIVHKVVCYRIQDYAANFDFEFGDLELKCHCGLAETWSKANLVLTLCRDGICTASVS